MLYGFILGMLSSKCIEAPQYCRVGAARPLRPTSKALLVPEERGILHSFQAIFGRRKMKIKGFRARHLSFGNMAGYGNFAVALHKC
jgi:hypothetical protein